MIHPDPETFTPDAAADASSDVAGWARGVLQRQAALLERLAEAGVEMVVSLKQREIEEPSASAAEEEARARAVARLGRCVRLTAALQTRLVKDVLAIGEARPAVTSVVSPIEPQAPQDQLRERVGRVVTRIIREQADGYQSEVERLSSDLWERLDDEDVYGDLVGRPIGQVVAVVCDDLGLSPDWPKLALEAWAIREMASGDPRSPFVALRSAIASPRTERSQSAEIRGLADPGSTPPIAGDAHDLREQDSS